MNAMQLQKCPQALPLRRQVPAILRPPTHQRSLHSCTHRSRVHAFNYNRGPDPADRILAGLPYLLPLLDALPLGACRDSMPRLGGCSQLTQQHPPPSLQHVHLELELQGSFRTSPHVVAAVVTCGAWGTCSTMPHV
jgi:hypothetical protein